jgi:hypothetical protein
MSSMFAALIVIAAAVGAFFWWRKQSSGPTHEPRSTKPAKRGQAQPTSAQRFASVELRCSVNACAAAQGLRDRAILATEAPVLPLAGCDAESCQCGYQKAGDRRQDGRRISDHGIQQIMFAGTEHRNERDRRTS